MKAIYFLAMLWLFNCHNTTSIDRDDTSVEKDTVVVCTEEDLSVRNDASEDSEFVSRYDWHLPDENKNLTFLPDKKEAFSRAFGFVAHSQWFSFVQNFAFLKAGS